MLPSDDPTVAALRQRWLLCRSEQLDQPSDFFNSRVLHGMFIAGDRHFFDQAYAQPLVRDVPPHLRRLYLRAVVSDLLTQPQLTSSTASWPDVSERGFVQAWLRQAGFSTFLLGAMAFCRGCSMHDLANDAAVSPMLRKTWRLKSSVG